MWSSERSIGTHTDRVVAHDVLDHGWAVDRLAFGECPRDPMGPQTRCCI